MSIKVNQKINQTIYFSFKVKKKHQNKHMCKLHFDIKHLYTSFQYFCDILIFFINCLM